LQRIYDDLDAASRHYAQACTVTAEAVEAVDRSIYLRLFSASDANAARMMLRDRLEQWLIAQAADEFAPGGARLAIDACDVLPPGEEHAKADRAFDAKALWNELERRFGGSKGESEAYRQAAALLTRELVSERRQPTRRGQNTVFQLFFFTESDWAGGRRMTYRSHELLVTILRAVSGFAAWAGDETLRFGADAANNAIRHNTPVVSRQRYALSGRASLVLYYEKAELILDNDLAELLQVFLQTREEETV